MARAVFLDRDGIINHIIMRGPIVASPRLFSEFKLIDGIKSLIAHIKSLGFLTIVVTNQPDIERKLMSAQELDKMHDFIAATLKIDAIEVCSSGDDNHPRRKPNPGMLLEATARYDIDLVASYLVGDSEKDILAARAAGTTSILLKTPYNHDISTQPDFSCASFEEIALLLTRRTSNVI